MTVSPSSSVEDVLYHLLREQLLDQPVWLPRFVVGELSLEQKARELERLQQLRAKVAAYEADLILGLADESPDTDDPPPDSPGGKKGGWSPAADLPGVSEFFTAHLSMVLNCGRGTAAHKAARAWTWQHNLPETKAALERGEIDEPRANALAEVLAHTDPEVARAVEARLLDDATALPLRRLKARAVGVMLELDAEAADRRHARARQETDVHVYPSHLDGMSTMAMDLPTEEATECYDAVDQIAKMLKADGDPRPLGEIRAAVASLLIRRPADHGLPQVTANVTITGSLSALSGKSTEPGAVNGLPITTGHLRELLEQVGALGLQTPDGGSMNFAITDDTGRLLATASLDQLRKLGRRGCRVHPSGDCQCPLLTPPPATDAYKPTDAQRVWVKTRDRTCRFPNCGQRVGWADLDHVIAHADGGETSCDNLCCLCRSHHRLKTFDRGWRFVMDDDGTLRVTTPSGITRITRPPGLAPPGAEPPPDEAEPEPQPADPDDDPPPF